MDAKRIGQQIIFLVAFFPQKKRVEVGRLARRVALSERHAVVDHGQQVCGMIPCLALFAVGHCD